jgi:PAS domain-containing protein
MKDLVEASEEFLKRSPGEMDHELITENVTRMSGAKIGTFNLYNDDGSEFTTVAFATAKKRSKAKASSIYDKQDDLIIERGRKYLGFDVIGKTWKHDAERARKIEGRTVTKFASLRALSGNVLPRPIIYLVERTFRTGEAAVIKIERDGRMLGDFTLIMPSGSKLINEDLIEIYSRMVGTMLIRRNVEKQLVEKTTLLQRLLNSIPEIIFVKDSAGRYVECNPHFLSMVGLRR